MSSLLRIRQLYPTLAQNDRKLADFLLTNPNWHATSAHKNWHNKLALANLRWSNLPKN